VAVGDWCGFIYKKSQQGRMILVLSGFLILFYDFDDRKQSWAYEPRQGLGDLWRVYRHTSDVENDSFLSSNCSGH